MRCNISHRVTLSGFHRCLQLFVIVLVCGCASQQPVSEGDRARSWETHKIELSRLNNWRLAGRISFRLEADAWSASLYWHQVQDTYNLRIVAPLAGGSLEINGDADSVSLKTAEDEEYTEQDVDKLMRDRLGWSIPISAMAYWIKGLPEPGVTAEKMTLDNSGNLAELFQSNWEVLYQAYTRSGGQRLPSRLQISREGIRVRLSINSWNIIDE